MKLCELTQEGSYLQLPQIARHEIQLLWCCDFWDFPLSGVLVYQGRKCWFENCEGQDEDDQNVRYIIIELTLEQLEHEEYWHQLFTEKVGTNMDFDENGKRLIGSVKSKDTHHEYYDAYKEGGYKSDFSQNRVLGWFDI